MKIEAELREMAFRFPARTSRNTLHTRRSWLVRVIDPAFPGRTGVGECAPIFGLSREREADLAEGISRLTQEPEVFSDPGFQGRYPALVMAMETALQSLRNADSWMNFLKTPKYPRSL
jgi:hypothetical protein